MFDDSKYHIVYPCGDKSKLTVVEICDALSYELSEYSVASRESFYDEDEANKYGRELAKKNNLIFESDSNEDYLD